MTLRPLVAPTMPMVGLDRHRRREALTMGLYVSITLLAALTVTDGQDVSELDVFAIVWGTTIGLVLAHWFAFGLATRLEAGAFHAEERKELDRELFAELAAAVAVAVVATVPVLLLPQHLEVAGARFATAGSIGVAAYAQTRAYGGSRRRALRVATFTLVAGLTVAAVKHGLGH